MQKEPKFFCFFLFMKQGVRYQRLPLIPMESKNTFNFRSSCLYLQNTGSIGMCHHIQFMGTEPQDFVHARGALYQLNHIPPVHRILCHENLKRFEECREDSTRESRHLYHFMLIENMTEKHWKWGQGPWLPNPSMLISGSHQK